MSTDPDSKTNPDNPDQIEAARGVARIIGPTSAASKAIADYERRCLDGENPICFSHNGTWLVMPRATFESISR